ncbi:MAG TPA: hypothetical protein VGC27_06680 [Rhizomicrobium sp.]
MADGDNLIRHLLFTLYYTGAGGTFRTTAKDDAAGPVRRGDYDRTLSKMSGGLGGAQFAAGTMPRRWCGGPIPALYRAKHTGRNRVVGENELPAPAETHAS